MKSCIYFFIVLFVFCLETKGQTKRVNIWPIGKTGLGEDTIVMLDFSSGMAPSSFIEPVNDGSSCLTLSEITSEPASSICDTAGNLMFYSDGRYVYGRNHDTLPNGALFAGLDCAAGAGLRSSTQGVLLVPQPGNDSLYYIFSNDAAGASNITNIGARYSIINKNLNGGMGDIVSGAHQILLWGDTMTEKLSAVHHANGNDIWVMYHVWNSDDFICFLLTTNGIEDTVVTSIGMLHGPANNGAVGQMKFSPDGTMLANVVRSPSRLELYEFDHSSGVLTNHRRFPFSENAYGVSFSPRSTKLYVTQQGPPTSDTLLQFDMLHGDSTTVAATRTVVGTESAGTENLRYGLQIAPNGKIYTRYGASAVRTYASIECPDQPGLACGFTPHALAVNDDYRISQFGSLTNTVESYFVDTTLNNVVDFSVDGICIGDSTTFVLTVDISIFDDYSWYITNDTIITGIGDTFRYLFDSSGNYEIKFLYTIGCLVDSVEKNVLILGGGNQELETKHYCRNGEAVPIGLASSGSVDYHWVPSQGLDDSLIANPNAMPDATTLYQLIITSSGCSDTGFQLVMVDSLVADYEDSALLCEGESYQMVSNITFSTNATYTWQPNHYIDDTTSSEPIVTPLASTPYIVTIVNAESECTTLDTITVNIENCDEPQSIFVPNAFTINSNGSGRFAPIIGGVVQSYAMNVYNRMGGLLFTSNDAQVYWEGVYNSKSCQDGVYLYALNITFEDGHTESIRGNVQLIR